VSVARAQGGICSGCGRTVDPDPVSWLSLRARSTRSLGSAAQFWCMLTHVSPRLCAASRLLKLDVNSAKQVIVGDGQTESLPFFSTELSPEAQEVSLSDNIQDAMNGSLKVEWWLAGWLGGWLGWWVGVRACLQRIQATALHVGVCLASETCLALERLVLTCNMTPRFRC
jgi:hypothetical protein